MYADVRAVTEISVNHANAQFSLRELNAHLNAGWILLEIHARGYDFSQEGQGARSFTVYILGHPDAKPERPTGREDLQ